MAWPDFLGTSMRSKRDALVGGLYEELQGE